MPNALIFDVDGVLADTEPISVRTLNRAFKQEHGITVRDEDSIPYMGRTAAKHVTGIAKQYGIHDTADIPALIQLHEDLFDQEITQTPNLVIPPSRDLLNTIAALDDWVVGLATSSTRTRSQLTIQTCQIDDTLLSAWLTGSDITKPKPHPEIYLAAAMALGVTPARCIVIEDSIAGLTAAKAAGMTCIALTGTFPGEALRDADRIVDTLADVNSTMLHDLIHEASHT
jgi:HAD superfamily hydrolase (TIGR01509 family)